MKNSWGCLHWISDLLFNFCVFSASTSSSLTLRSATISWEFGMVHLGHQMGGSCWKNGLAQPYLKISTRLLTFSRFSLIRIISSASKDFLYSSPVSRLVSIKNLNSLNLGFTWSRKLWMTEKTQKCAMILFTVWVVFPTLSLTSIDEEKRITQLLIKLAN